MGGVGVIGDVDPEDAWDAGDPPAVLLEVLDSMVTDLVREVAAERYDRTRVLTRWSFALVAVEELRARHAAPVVLHGIMQRLHALAGQLQP